MSKPMTPLLRISVTSRDPQETRLLGCRLGQLLPADAERGTILCLYGELATGKTALVQGLAQGLGVPEGQYVTSPTYTLVNTHSGRVPLHHVDLYRLAGPDDFEAIGLPELLEEAAVVAIEWSERFADHPPPRRLVIEILVNPDDSRTFGLAAYGQAEKVLLQRLSDALSG